MSSEQRQRADGKSKIHERPVDIFDAGTFGQQPCGFIEIRCEDPRGVEARSIANDDDGLSLTLAISDTGCCNTRRRLFGLR